MKLFSKKQFDVPRRRATVVDDGNENSSDLFRRNRTLTGRTPGGVSLGVDSPRIHVHHLTIKRRKVFSAFMIVILSIGVLWWLISSFTASVAIVTPDASISETIDASTYSKVIQEYLDSSPFSRFSFFLDQTSLSEYVASQLPEVSSVVEKNMIGIGVTNFSITMRLPVAGWKIENKQYYVDAKGVPFEKNYYSDPVVQIVDNSGASLQTGSASVSKRFLSFVGLVISLANDSGHPISQAILPANTTRELDVVLKENNLLVKLSIDRPVGEQIEDMSRAVQYFASNNQLPTYIDIRVSGRAFFK